MLQNGRRCIDILIKKIILQLNEMKRTKRIFAVVLSCVMVFSLAACGGKKDDTAKVKDVVAKFMTAIKNADVEGIKKTVDKKHADELKNNGTESQREKG